MGFAALTLPTHHVFQSIIFSEPFTLDVPIFMGLISCDYNKTSLIQILII